MPPACPAQACCPPSYPKHLPPTPPTHPPGMLSPEGRCKTLDASADGYVRAEAAGALLLQAVWGQDPDPEAGSWLAVLAGSCVNQDGRSSSLTAPNGPAQQVSQVAGHTLYNRHTALISAYAKMDIAHVPHHTSHITRHGI